MVHGQDSRSDLYRIGEGVDRHLPHPQRRFLKREYRNFPANLTIDFDLDPQETLISTFEGVRDDEACDKYLEKWTQKLKKGKITPKQ